MTLATRAPDTVPCFLCKGVKYTAPYIQFTKEQRLRASSIDLESFLYQNGERLLKSGREKRLESNHSITIRGNEWFDHATGEGGGPISFAQTYYGLSFPEAMSLLLGGESGQTSYPRVKDKTISPTKPFALPAPNGNMRRVYAYLLKERKLDRDIVSWFARTGTLYEDSEHHNCVFVGRDETGTPRHAHVRSTNTFGKTFRINIEGSDPRYSFHHIGNDGQLFVFEAPIDLMSFISLKPREWESRSYVACCGTSIQPVLQTLEQMDSVDMVYLCLDNDAAGLSATERMGNRLQEQGVPCSTIIPQLKDWNDDLKAKERQMEEATCQAIYIP